MRPGRFAIALVLVLTACGTRLPDRRFEAQATGGSGTGSGDTSADTSTDSIDGGLTAGDGTVAGVSGATTGTGGTSTGGGKASTGGGTSSGGGGGSGISAGGEANTASDVGVTPSSIKVGNITAIQGIFGPEAFGVSLRGLKAYFAALNDRGGVNGRKVQLVTCDDRENAAQNLACAQKLVDQDKIFAFVANNSDASARSAKFVSGKGVPDLGFPLNTGYYKYPNMFSVYPGVGYPRDGKQVGVKGTVYQQTAAYRWFKQQRKVDKAAVFFYTIKVSQSQGYAIENDLKASGIETVYEGGGSHGGLNPAAPSFDTDVVNMRQRNVTGIWDAIDIGANQKMCEAMDRQSFKVTAKVSTIQAWGQLVGSEFSSPCKNSVYSQGFSVPYSESSSPAVQKMFADLDKYLPGTRPKMHEWTLEGYAMGEMFTEGIKSMGAKPTRAGWINWMNTMRDYTGSGLFSPRDYRKLDFSQPFLDCSSIVQWDSAKNTMATRHPVTECVPVKWVGYQPADDGA